MKNQLIYRKAEGVYSFEQQFKSSNTMESKANVFFEGICYF